MAEDGTETLPWCDGNYKSLESQDIFIVKGEKATSPNVEMTFRHGAFGEADAKIVEMTGERCYTVQARFHMMDKEITYPGVVLENGTKLVFKTSFAIHTLELITDEEVERLANEGDPIDAPTIPYKVEPQNQGRLIWITGLPGLGKSTSAQFLSREHGFVYYEADCFFSLKNPYIPPDVENPTLAIKHQRKLIGERAVERRALIARCGKEYAARLKGESWDRAMVEEMFKEMLKDISRERSRLGGHWVIAGLLDTVHLRAIARTELGEKLEIVVLNMTPEQQEARLRSRHDGNKDAVEMMEVWNNLFELGGEDEPNTVNLTVTSDMTPAAVVSKIMGGNSSN